MKIQIWSDFVCPFCFIGKRHLEEAIKQSGKEVEIEMMSFELDQNAQPEKGVTMHQILADKYGMSLAEAKANNDRVAKMAADVGLVYNFDTMQAANTFQAHRVFQFAKLQGKGNEFAQRAMVAVFEEGLDVDTEEVLIQIGKDVGLTEEQVKQALSDESFGLKVRQDEQWSQMIGAKGVPHFVFNDKVSLSGAQPITTFIEAMEYVENLQAEPTNNDAPMCDDGVCKV